jgi:hypothetical protein
MKYIFVAGAPGSKWSSVVKNIYFSEDIDHSDYSEARTYWHDAPGHLELRHTGAYFDPGMEFSLPEDLEQHSKEDLEKIFDSAFTSNGIRIIKSHMFSIHIDFIRKTWPECPMVLVHRSNDSCLGWWVKCGHFNITYPSYDYYFVDFKTMAKRIQEQNASIEQAMFDNPNGKQVGTNLQLCRALGIAEPLQEYWQNYAASDIKVTVI